MKDTLRGARLTWIKEIGQQKNACERGRPVDETVGQEE